MSGTVLFVDDEPNVLAALERLFADDESVAVRTAANGPQALEIVGAGDVDLVVSDQMMPGMNGLTLLTEMRKQEVDIPVVLLTGYSGEIDPEQVFESVGEHVVVVDKPWDRAELCRVIQDHLARRTLDPEEQALARYGGISLERLERAKKIRARMQRPDPLGSILVQLGELSQEDYDRIERSRRSNLDLADLLHELGHLSGEGLAKYVEAKSAPSPPDDKEILVGAELVTEEQYLRALATKHDIPYQEPDIGAIDVDLMSKTSFRYLMRNKALPVRARKGVLQVILADPLDQPFVTELGRIFGCKVTPACCVGEKITETLRTLERLRSGEDVSSAGSLQYREIEEADGDDTGEEAVRIVDYLLTRAIQIGASDLHIEPLQTKIRVRVRVDGVLQQLTELPPDIGTRLASRVKILAGADIAEKRLHQDGKIFVKVEGREVDIRVSSYVSVYGENLVMRLLDRNQNLLTVEQIGFAPRIMSLIEDVILKASTGLVLITGPTGSGKTTTLYSLIQHSNDPSEKVITAEDPVEYVIDGIVQCSVNQKTGPTFADSLRAIVRQDPDTILVGEIRDGTTASLACESALTGHKVFSTFHTEDAVSVVVRLLEMGIEPFLVSSVLSAIMGQRLLRRLCSKCAQPGEPARADMRFLGLDRAWFKGVRMMEPQGCGHCNGSGYRGRLGIHEVLVPDDDFKDAVLARAPAKELRVAARRLPEFLTLQEDALLKMVHGLTSLTEVVENAPRDIGCRPLAKLMSIAGIGRKE